MPTHALDVVLEAQPFFEGFTPEQSRIVSGCARNHRFDAGRYLFHEGEAADEFFLIRHGKVALEIVTPGQPPIVIATLGEGEIVGASWLAPPYRWMFDARAVELTRAIGIDATCLRNKCDADPQLGYEMMKRFLPVLAKRLKRHPVATARRLRKALSVAAHPHGLALAATDPLVPELYRVEAVRRELSDTVTLELAPVSGNRPDYGPGQFNMVYAFGVGEIAISISGNHESGNRFIHTVRDVGAVSRAIAASKPGDILGVRGPFGTSWPVGVAVGADILFVAGGLGLAPLRPAILEVLENRARYGRVAILFGTRNPTDMLFRSELESWRSRLDIEVEVTVDHADQSWHGHVGVVPELIRYVQFDPAETVAFVCGPEVMMRFTATALNVAGVANDRIYLSMERNMKCAVGLCGHCQFGPHFVCKDGAVMRYDAIAEILSLREI